MFRLIVWDQAKWEVPESIRTDHVSMQFRKQWRDYEIYMERDTVHAAHKWSLWNSVKGEWIAIAEMYIPSMVRMTAMLLR